MPNQLTTRQVYLEMAGVGAFGSTLFFVLMMLTLQTIQQKQKPRLPRAVTTLAGTAAGLVTAVVADVVLEERFAESNVEDGAKDLLMCVMTLAIMGNFSLGGFNLETIFRLGCSGVKAILPASCFTFFKTVAKSKDLVDLTLSAIELVDVATGLSPTTSQFFRAVNSSILPSSANAEEKNRQAKEESDASDTGTYVPPTLGVTITDVRS
jgi:hypothetical protein